MENSITSYMGNVGGLYGMLLRIIPLESDIEIEFQT